MVMPMTDGAARSTRLCPLEDDILSAMVEKPTQSEGECARRQRVSRAMALTALLHLAMLGLVDEWTAWAGEPAEPVVTGTFTITPRGRLVARLRAHDESAMA
jgi:hypothetical protein